MQRLNPPRFNYSLLLLLLLPLPLLLPLLLPLSYSSRASFRRRRW